MSQQEKVEAAKSAARKKARKFEELFNTPLGKQVLDAMSNEFDIGEMRGKSVEDTYFNLGRRDAVVYIKQMITYSERENETK